MIANVVVSRLAVKQLRKAPRHVARKLMQWTANVERFGLEETRKVPGFHDEPLRGDRQGQRSIRLSKKWRAVYVLNDNAKAEFVSIEEVTPHDY